MFRTASNIYNSQEMVDFLVDIWEQEGMYDWESVNAILECKIYDDQAKAAIMNSTVS